MVETNPNEVNVLEQEPVFKEVPFSQDVSLPINNLSQTIQNRAKVNTLAPNLKYGFSDYSAVNQLGKDTRTPIKKFDIGKDAFVELSSGELIPRFEKFLPGVNNEELLALEQTNGDKWSNAIPKFLGKTLVNVVGGTIGTVEGLINGIRMQSLSAVYDSDFNNYLEDLNKKLDYNLPNYYTEQEKNMNFGQKLFTTNFWANDFLGGVSFLAGTVISEALWAVATGGTSLVAKGIIGGTSRVLSKTMGKSAYVALNQVKSTGKAIIRNSAKGSVDDLIKSGINANRITQGLNTARFMYTSAGFEAGVEARHYMSEATEEWKRQFVEQNGRNPNPKEIGEFTEDLTNTANGLFAGNVGLVGTSNLAILGKLLLNRAPSRAISNSLFKKTFLGVGYQNIKGKGIQVLNPTRFQKTFSKVYSVGRPAFIEGFVEEGGQAVMSTAAKKYIMSAYDKTNVNGGLSLIEALKEGFEYAYGTKEGLTEVGLGSLIGVLGGGFATRGRFNEVSQERAQLENTANYINQFHQSNLIETLKFNAKVRKATIQSEKAKAEGDLTAEMRADTSAMTALIERGHHYQSNKEMTKDFMAGIDAMDNAEISQNLNLTEEEVAEWKADKKKQFTELVDTHTKNLEFADAMVGGAPIAGLDKIDASGVLDLKSAIAYTLTMGKQSDEFAESLANQIKLTIANDLTVGEDLDAITVNDVLRRVSVEKQTQFNTASTKLSKIAEEIKKVENAIIETQALEDKKDNQSKANKLSKLNLKFSKLQEQATALQQEKTLAFQAMNIPQLTDELITEDMLDNQAENISKLKSTIDSIAAQDPQTGQIIESLYAEYNRAIANNKTFNQLVEGLLSPKTRVDTLNGWISSIINRKKEVNGETAVLFTNLIKEYQLDLGRLRTISVGNEGVSEGVNEGVNNQDPLAQEPEDITDSAQEQPEQKVVRDNRDVVQRLKAQLKVIIENDPYTNLRFEGGIQEDFNEIKPSEDDVARYDELLGKINPGKRVSTILLNPYNKRNNTGLTKAETEELQNLNSKLNNWKILSGFNINDNSIAEVLGLINQLETTYKLTPTSKQVEVRDFMRPEASSRTEASVSRNPLNTLVTPDIPVAKKVSSYSSYEISHLEPTSLTELFPGSTLAVVTNGKQVDVNTLPIERLIELQKTADTDFILTIDKNQAFANSELMPKSEISKAEYDDFIDNGVVTPGRIRSIAFKVKSRESLSTRENEIFTSRTGEINDIIREPSIETVKFTVNDRQRLVVNIEELEDIMPTSNMRILNFGNSSFMPVFTRVGENFKPLDGDFTIESINDNEFINLDSQRLYDFSEGEILRTVVNLNDSYNDKLIKDFKDEKISEEELINNINIYVAPQGAVNDIVGTLRAIKPSSNPNSDSFAKLHMIRKQAVKKALSSPVNRVEVGITVPIKNILIGSPNLTVREQNNNVVPVNNPLTPEALQEISDYGYILNGTIFSKNNLEYSRKDSIFAREASSKAENVDKKIPVVVFKYRNRTVVFPVSLVSRPGTKADRVRSILNNRDQSDASKIFEINELLIDSNIDPTTYGISDLESEISLREVNRLLEDLSGLTDVVEVDSWLEDTHDKQNLLSEVQIAIDITDKPFNAPKGILNFNDITLPDEQDLEIEAVNVLDNLAKKVNKRFGEDNPFSEMVNNSAFFDAFEQEGIDRTAETYLMKKRNANILRNAFNTPIPKRVREVLGEDLIKLIRNELKQYELLSQGLKTNTKVVNEEMKSEIDQLKTECN